MASMEQALQIYSNAPGQNVDISVLQTMIMKLSQINININQIDNSFHMVDNSIRSIDQSVHRVEQGVGQASRAQEDLNQEIEESQDKTKELSSLVDQLAQKAKSGFDVSVQFVKDTLSLDYVQKEAERNLKNSMRLNLGASPNEIQSVQALAKAQQQLGVVSDQAQMAGIGQLSGYAKSTAALSALVPAMNDLAVYQNGAKVSAEHMTAAGTMMGEAMQGNVASLAECGIQFSQSQADLMKYGSEEQKVATLSRIITDHVGNMNAAMALTPQGKIEQLGNAWEEMKEQAGGQLYGSIMMLFEAISNNLPQIEWFIEMFTGGLNLIVTALSGIINFAGMVASVIQENWAIIGPQIMGIISILAVFLVVMQMISMATAIWGVMTTLAASPLLIVIAVIIGIIAAIYTAVGAINQFTGSTISATGLIAGSFYTMALAIANQFLYIWNTIVIFINFFYNVWKDPINSVKILFLDLAINVLGYISSMVRGIEAMINAIPGVQVDITSGIDSFKNELESKVKNIKDKSEWEEVVSKKEYFDLEAGFKKGYEFGEGAENKIKNVFDGTKMPDDLFGGGGQLTGIEDSWNNINQNTANTAGNTAAMADSMDMAQEDLKSLRDIAEQEIINRFTTADLTVNMGGITNQINSNMDLDGIAQYLDDAIFETLEVAAEGVY